MMKENINQNIEIIKQAYKIFCEEDFIYKYSAEIEFSDFEGIGEKDYNRVNKLLKAVRQDFTKIMVTMNAIDREYKQYQKDQYPVTYYGVITNQACEELACQIEYLFAKYRVILEYLESIMKILILPTIKGDDYRGYSEAGSGKPKREKQEAKFEWLIKYIGNHYKECPVMNTEWFENLRKTRNAIIHKGATCLVFGDKERLLFNIYMLDGIETDEEQIEWDDYYKVENDLIRYDRYWGLYYSKLIVFCNAVLKFINGLGKLSDGKKWMIDNFGMSKVTELVDSETDEKIPDVRTMPAGLLKTLIEEYEGYGLDTN